jgi:hypothetical protein
MAVVLLVDPFLQICRAVENPAAQAKAWREGPATTETIESMVTPIDQLRLAQQLVEQARAEGVELIGPGGLLTGLTKSVLETALEAEMSEPGLVVEQMAEWGDRPAHLGRTIGVIDPVNQDAYGYWSAVIQTLSLPQAIPPTRWPISKAVGTTDALGSMRSS